MQTVIQDPSGCNPQSQPHWDRFERADLFEQYWQLQSQGISQRQAAKQLQVPRTTLQAWQAWHDTLDICPEVAQFFQSGPGLAFLHRLVMAFHLVAIEVGACGIRLASMFLRLSGLDRFVAASYGAQQQVNQRVETAIVDYHQAETARLAHGMPQKDLTVAQDETFTGGLCLVAMDPDSNFIILEQLAQARDQATWNELMAPALAPLNCRVIQSTSDEAAGLLAYVEHYLGAHHSPDLFHVQQELTKAVSAPIATKVRAAQKAVSKAQQHLDRLSSIPDEPCMPEAGSVAETAVLTQPAHHALDLARQDYERLAHQQEQARQLIRAIGQAYHFVDLDRGVRRNGLLITADIQKHIDHIRVIAQTESLSQSGLDRIEKAERVVPKMQATIEFVSGYVGQQVNQLGLSPAQSHAMHARLIPAAYLERVAQTRTVTQGEPLRKLAEQLRTSVVEPGGVLSELSLEARAHLQSEAKRLATVFQRSSSNVEGRNGYLSLRHHQLRGLNLPRKRECFTAIHNFLITRSDGTTAAERFFGQKPRSMFAAILDAVELPPAPLSPPRRA